jgi:hypothetical protein
MPKNFCNKICKIILNLFKHKFVSIFVLAAPSEKFLTALALVM